MPNGAVYLSYSSRDKYIALHLHRELERVGESRLGWMTIHLSMSQPEKVSNGIPADLKSKLWQAADKLRGHLSAAEYNVVLGLKISSSTSRMHFRRSMIAS